MDAKGARFPGSDASAVFCKGGIVRSAEPHDQGKDGCIRYACAQARFRINGKEKGMGRIILQIVCFIDQILGLAIIPCKGKSSHVIIINIGFG